MLICAAGDIHGAMDRMYEDVLAFETALGVRFEWVLHVGDFGVWPDVNRIDKATALVNRLPTRNAGRTHGCQVSDRYGLADTFRYVADVRAA